jgi:hypothetical protein
MSAKLDEITARLVEVEKEIAAIYTRSPNGMTQADAIALGRLNLSQSQITREREAAIAEVNALAALVNQLDQSWAQYKMNQMPSRLKSFSQSQRDEITALAETAWQNSRQQIASTKPAPSQLFGIFEKAILNPVVGEFVLQPKRTGKQNPDGGNYGQAQAQDQSGQGDSESFARTMASDIQRRVTGNSYTAIGNGRGFIPTGRVVTDAPTN